MTPIAPAKARLAPWPDTAIAVALVLGALGLYCRVARFDFINFDDDIYVFRNARVCAGITLDNLSWAFTTGFNSNWHPLTWLSHMIDVRLLGVRAGAMHLENAAIHAINAALLYVVLAQLTGARWPSAWVAAMFAAHPLHVESVAWISERKDVLSTLFMMLCILAYVRYGRSPTPARYFVVLLMLILGLMCKPMLVTLPCVLLLLDFWPLRRITFATPQAADTSLAPSRQLRCLIVEKIPLFAVALVSAVITYTVQSAGRSVSNTPLSIRASNAVVSYVTYLQQTLVPRGLAIFYPYQHWPAWLVIASALILFALAFTAVAMRRRAPYVTVGILWYLITLLPVIGLIQVGSQSRADRYTYVPLIGIFIAAAWLVLSAQRVPRPLCMFLGISTILVSSFGTWRQIGYWRNAETVMRRAIEVVPDNYAAHSMLGEVLADRGETSAAAREYRLALRIKPDDVVSLNNLAVQEAADGRPTEALEIYHRAIAADPNFAPVRDNLANLFVRRGQIDDAIAQYRAAIARDPQYSQAFHNLALTLASSGKLNEAIDLWRRAVGIDPYYADARASLGNALVMTGRASDGIDEMRAALRLQPDRVDTLNSLAWILATHPSRAFQEGAQAEHYARRAVELTHARDPIPLDTLAASFARQGKFTEAIETAQLAAALADETRRPELAEQIRRRIERYRSGRPYGGSEKE